MNRQIVKKHRLQDFDEVKDNLEYWLSRPPGRIDILTSISGVNWDEAFEGKVEGTCGDVPVNFLGRE